MPQSYRNLFFVFPLVFALNLAGKAQTDDALQFRHVVVDAEAPDNMHTKSVGDLNGDGLTDLIVAGTGGMLVWYEQPDWEKHVIASGGGGWSTDAEAGDVDRDGDQDLVISDWYQKNRLVWFENPGQGVGDWQLHLIGEPRAHDLELADFDRDGDVDVVTRQQGRAGDKLEIWIQDKPDTWQHHTLDCPVGEGLAVADVDRDGDVDIAIGARWYETPDDVTKNSWTEHVYASDWQHAACVVKTADVNRDGREDIVLTPAENAGGTYRIAWYEAPQDPRHGRWREHVIDAAVETVLHSLAVADLSGDGNPDVVTAAMHQGKDPDQVRVYINGDGGRRWTKHVVAEASSHGIRVLDADDDGDLDVFGADWSGSRQVDLWENVRDRAGSNGGRLSLNRWTYLEIDARRSGRAFGLAMADLTGDGRGDIVSGRYFYRNPGGNMTGRWPRSTFPLDADALLALDVDQDGRGDVIALDAAGKVYWLEAEDAAGVAWKVQRVGDVGKADHKISSQGYALGQLVTGGKPEIIINVGSIYYFEIPKEPGEAAWPRTAITHEAYPEGVGVGDFDRDGKLDVCGTIDNKQVAWWKNPGKAASGWQSHSVGAMPDKYADRFYADDLNGDSRLDIVVSAANGTKNGVYWWEQLEEDAANLSWKLHTVVVQDTTNSMDVADMDGDGDTDIIAGEHRGKEKVAIWENDGRGRFTETVVSTGKESHLGTRVADLDGDGDLDIASIAWDQPNFLHLWRNDAIPTRTVKKLNRFREADGLAAQPGE